MPNEQIADYIRRAREARVEDNEIRQNLLGSGFSAMEVEERLSISGKMGAGVVVSPAKRRISFRFGKPLIIIIVIIALVIGGYFVLARYLPQYAKYVQPYLGPVLDPVMEQIRPMLDKIGLSAPSTQVNSMPSLLPPSPKATEGTAGQSLDFARDWKTYRNFEYGFEFKYPRDWFILGGGERLTISTTGKLAENEGDPGEEIHISSWSSKESAEKIVNPEDWLIYNFALTKEYIWFYDGSNGIRFAQTDSAPSEDPDNLESYALHNDRVFRITVSPYSKYKNIYNQILSTFKFPPDADGDGLPDDEEPNYNTNPNNPDMDDDGYLDGQEVQNGYNPLGPGRATQ